jgi:peptide/nickel transport system substrate-binding protein
VTREPNHSRRPLFLGGLLALAVLAAAGALALRLTGSDSGVLTQTGVYVEGVAGTWQRVNPLYASLNEVDQDLAQLVFSGLVRVGPDGAVVPDMADLPQVSDDGRTYTFRLRKNLSWHDGTPVTSRDVAFTISRLTDPDFKGDTTLAEAWLGVEVETPDASTVVFRLKQASAPFLARNTTIGILPEHLLRGLSAAALFDAPFNAAAVGSGPYRLQSLDSREATLVANENYHLGRPGIPTIKLRFYTDYPSAIRALESGAIDGLMVRDSLSEARQTELGKVKGMKLEQPARAAYLVLYLNNDQAAFFQDDRVRLALSLGINRQSIVDTSFLGAAVASSSAIAPGTWAYAKEYDQPTANVSQARKLLDDAGWKAHPTTGILVKEGQEFRFTIRTDTDPLRVAVANEIARQLEPLGIRATVASTTFSVLRRDFLQERKYDAALAGWDQGPDPDPYFGWHSSQTGTAGLNLANYSDVVADSLIAKGRTTTDREVRKDAYRQFQEVWSEQAPSVVIAYPRYTYVHSAAVKIPPLGILFSAALRFSEVHRWKQ